MVLLAVGLVAGWGAESSKVRLPRTPSLEGVPWVLSSGLETPGWERAAPSATFTNGRIAGSSGCNRYTAPYTLDGEAMTIGELATTQMACDPLGEAVQRDYVAALARVEGWRLPGTSSCCATATARAAALRRAVAGRRLGGDRIQSDAVASPTVGTKITASFREDGTLAGSAGCNPYNTTFTSERGKIEIAALASGRKACTEPEGVMEQAQAYLSALPLAAEYRVEGGDALAADGRRDDRRDVRPEAVTRYAARGKTSQE